MSELTPLCPMGEDFEESPVWLVHREAQYIATEQPGHIYVVDVEELKRTGVDVHDLTDISSDRTLRPIVQSACLAGTLNGTLPPLAVIAHLTIESNVLAAFCGKAGLKNTTDVFPPREQDFILQALLNIPWERIPTNGPLPAYRRGLDIPEYDARFVKHLSPKVALFSPFWIAEHRGSSDSPFQGIPFYRISEDAYYANSEETFSLGEVNKLLKKWKSVAVELDGLISIPESKTDYEFEKGVFVELIEEDVVCVSGLLLEHPGQIVAGLGAVKGWYYRIVEDSWVKVEHPDQCPCNNDLRHELQFALLRVLGESLAKNEFVTIDAVNYIHKDIA